MTVDTGKTRCANQLRKLGTTSFTSHRGITAFRRETQVGHIQQVPLLPRTQQAVFRLDVSMDDITRMDILQTTKELVNQHQDCFEREFATAKIEKVFQTWTQEIKHHGVILALSRIGVHSWDTSATGKRLIDVGFTFEEGGIDRNVLQFDGHLVTGVDIGRWYVFSESYEATVSRGIFRYLCIQRRSYHRRFSFAAAIYRPHVDPNVSHISVSIHLVSATNSGQGTNKRLRGEQGKSTQDQLTRFPIAIEIDRYEV